MAAGYRSRTFWWFTGYAKPSTGPLPPEPVVCTCPSYKRESTLSNQFIKDASLSNQFKDTQTLTNQWGRRNCNG